MNTIEMNFQVEVHSENRCLANQARKVGPHKQYTVKERREYQTLQTNLHTENYLLECLQLPHLCAVMFVCLL